MLRAGIILTVGKMIRSNNSSAGRRKRKWPLIRPMFRQKNRLKSGFRERE
jgi:hypothetical protein